MEESHWDAVAYDFGTQPEYVRDCVNWFIDLVLDEPDQVKKAQARASWHRMWTKDVREMAGEWVRTFRPGTKPSLGLPF